MGVADDGAVSGLGVMGSMLLGNNVQENTKTPKILVNTSTGRILPLSYVLSIFIIGNPKRYTSICINQFRVFIISMSYHYEGLDKATMPALSRVEGSL